MSQEIFVSASVKAPKRAGSVVVAHGLSCPVACGILVPRPGIEPVSPALQDGFLTTEPPGKCINVYMYKYLYSMYKYTPGNIYKSIHYFNISIYISIIIQYKYYLYILVLKKLLIVYLKSSLTGYPVL